MSILFKVIFLPVVITALAVTGVLYQWRLEIMIPALSILLIISIMLIVSYFNQRGQEHSFSRLKELGLYFIQRFAGSSSLSIFTIIEDSLFNVDSPRLREWLRGCNMSQLIFNAWCEGFGSRIESDNKTRYNAVLIRIFIRELWSLVIHYQEFIEQYFEVAEKVEIPQESVEQYNRFALEYNAFVQKFRGYIGTLRGIDKTEIEPPSVKLARELQLKRIVQSEPKEEKPIPVRDESKGYITGRTPAPKDTSKRVK